jgi:CRP-like cAMP-binding protein
MDRKKILAGIDVFKGLSPDEIAAIDEICEELEFRANETILSEKSRGRRMYVLKKGKVRIDFAVVGKEDVATVHRVAEGQIFGELAVLDEGPRSATAHCEADSEVIAIRRDRLYELFEKRNHIGYVFMKNIAQILAGKLRKTNLQLVACLLWE